MPYKTKEIEENSISDTELKYYLGEDVPIITYPNLKKYNSINQLLPSEKTYLIILYLDAPNSGHWVSIKRLKNNIIEVFCSYGTYPDEQLEWYPDELNYKLNQKEPYLTNLLNKWIGDVYYNNIKYQKLDNNIVTCGRHMINNILLMLKNNMNMSQYYKFMKKLKKKENKTYDEIVSERINIILD